MFKNIANMDLMLNSDAEVENIPEAELEPCEQKVAPKKNFAGAFFKFCAFVLAIGLMGSFGYKKLTSIDTSFGMLNGIFNDNVLTEVVPETGVISAASVKREIISSQQKIVKFDPFMPYRDVSPTYNAPPDFELLEPPESSSELSEAGRIMDTYVSGILYDIYSPSAILNIEGVDQLVKKGDRISNYEVLEIEKNVVTVKLGANIYRAGIGEILTSGEINYNNISNLDTKFGGKNGNN